MILALAWNWYEIVESATVSIAFVLIPIMWHAENRHRKVMAAHKSHADRLDRLEKQ